MLISKENCLKIYVIKMNCRSGIKFKAQGVGVGAKMNILEAASQVVRPFDKLPLEWSTNQVWNIGNHTWDVEINPKNIVHANKHV